MSPTPRPRHPRRGSAALAPLLGLLTAGCALDAPPGPDDEDTTAAPIWAQVPGAHQTTKQLTWEQVASSLPATYALTSATTGSPPRTTLRVFYRDSAACLRSLFQVDGAAGWFPDTTLHSCGDPGFDGPPAAVSWSVDRYDVFWFQFPLFSRAHLMHVFWDGAAWRTEDLGATATDGAAVPMVGTWATGHLDVFWRDGAGDLRQRIFDRGKKGAPGFDANGWQLTDTLSAHYFAASAAIAEPAVGEIDLAYRNGVGKLTVMTSTTGGASWTYANPAIVIDGAPALASWGGGSLMAIATRASSTLPFRQLTRDAAGTWRDVGFPTTQTAAAPVAAASPTRPYRLDVLASPAGAAVYHAFYQESLPGFAELPNPDTDHWCWANASGMVINYLAQGTAGWTPQATCQFVGVDKGQNCCGAIADASCYTEGNHDSVLDDYGVTWTDKDLYTFDQLRVELQVKHKPVILREAHNNDSGGHVVVIRDVYQFGGVAYVELADPANNGLTWVWPYDTLMAYNTNWHVDYMQRGFALP